MQHLGSTKLKETHFAAMRSACNFELLYHEADPYTRFLHPLPRAARAAGRFSDVVFTVGSGVFADNFRRARARDVRWASHGFEPERYRYAEVEQNEERTYDVVVVANRNRPRLRGHPNWRDRIRFVQLLQERFGERVAVFGAGWEGVGAKGPVDTSLQDHAIRSAWISANWDHYANEPDYFSNRLPISMASGSIHATTRHPGYDKIFGKETTPFLIFDSSPERLCDSIEDRLSNTSPAERILAGEAAQEYAYQKYRQDDQLVSFLNYRETRIDSQAASEVWDIDSFLLRSF